jgi:hypothetical protein
MALVIAMQRLTALLGGPVAWTLHFMASYGVVAVACALGTSGAGVILGVMTVLLAAAALASGLLAFLRWRTADGEARTGSAPVGQGRGDAERVLMVVGMLGASLFTVAIVLQGVVPIFVPTCA